MIDVAELWAFCDLHVSRWHVRRQALFNDLSTFGALPMFYDRKGFPIPADPDDAASEPGWIMPTLVWARMMQDRDYRIVGLDDLPDGSYLSTVWLGLDHSHGLSRPLIFETMRFSGTSSEYQLPGVFGGGTQAYHPSMEFPDPYGELGEMTEQLRYASEEEAAAAHREIVRRLRLRHGH